MEDNEKEVEETTNESETNDEELETNDEDTQDEDTNEEETEDNEDGTPTIEDYQKLKKEAETLKAQKEHWRKKAQTSKPLKEEVKKEINIEQVKETDVIELARLASRGYSDEEISLLKDIKSLKGLNNLADAIETPLFKANLKEKQDREKREKASLNASGKPLAFKSGKEPSMEDLKKAWTGK